MNLKKARLWITILSIILVLVISLNGCYYETGTDITSPPTQTTPSPSPVSPSLSPPISPLIDTETVATWETIEPEATESSTKKTEVVGDLKVNFLDVGQGDSIFIELPTGETMLIDAGESQCGTSIVEYIEDKGYDSVDYLIASHPHADHIGGMAFVINNLNIGSIYMRKAQANTYTFENLLITIQEKGLNINSAKEGVCLFDFGNLKADIIAPVSDGYGDLNNYSAVIKLTYGETSYLFMGDAPKYAENEITADIDADVLKIAHHGSAHSSEQDFLERVSPTIAVISVGEDNKYGHPAQELLNRLKLVDPTLLRTDTHGTITVLSDGYKLNYSTEKSGDPWTSLPASNPQVSDTIIPAISDTENETIVYVTATGEKYHREGCQYLARSQIPMALDEVIAAGYGACSRCSPPKLSSDESSFSYASESQPTITAAPTEEPAQSERQDTTVYKTKTGSKYHMDGCQYLSRSKIAISLSNAKSQGYTPCSKCGPPS